MFYLVEDTELRIDHPAPALGCGKESLLRAGLRARSG
jgi:hypothetical protein